VDVKLKREMKRFALMIIPALICGGTLLNCSSDKAEPQDEKTMGELYVMGTRSATEDKLDLLFTVDDIKSFKTGKTIEVANGGAFYGELVFTDKKADDLSRLFGHYTMIHFFIGEKLLFDPPIKIFNPFSSMSANDLQMSIFDDKIFLVEFYQFWDWLPAAEREAKLKAQEENSKMRKKQLDVFFKYLSDAGKIDDTVPPIIEIPTPEIPIVQDSTKIK